MNDENRKRILQEMSESLNQAEEERRPEGDDWFDLEDIVKEKGWSLDKARDRATTMVQRGLWEKSKRYGLKKYYRVIKKTDQPAQS